MSCEILLSANSTKGILLDYLTSLLNNWIYIMETFLGPTFWHFPPKLIQSEWSWAVKCAFWSARVFIEDFAWHFKQSICVSGFRCSAEMCRKGWGPTILLTYIKGRIRWACVLLFFLHNLGSHAATYRYRMTWELLWKASSLKSSGLLFASRAPWSYFSKKQKPYTHSCSPRGFRNLNHWPFFTRPFTFL